MTEIKWIDPTKEDYTKDDGKWKIEVEKSTDPYGNHCRMWTAIHTSEHCKEEYWDHIRLHSGTNGVSLRVNGTNNGYVHLSASMVDKLIKELQDAIPYSRESQSKWSAYWDKRNSLQTPEY